MVVEFRKSAYFPFVIICETGSAFQRIHHVDQPEVLYERREVAVFEKQGQPIFDAASSNDGVDGSAHSDSAAPKRSEMNGSPQGGFTASEHDDWKCKKRVMGQRVASVGVKPVENFRQNQISNGNPFLGQEHVQSVRLR